MKKLITIFGVVALMPLMLNAFTKKDVLILIGMTDYEYEHLNPIWDMGLWMDDDGNLLDSCGVGLTPFDGGPDEYWLTCDSLKAELDAGNKKVVDITSGMRELFPWLFEGEEGEFDIDMRLHLADFNIFYLSEKDIYVRDTGKDVEPEFPGGVPALLDFVSACMRYPKQSMDAGVQGKVMVSFVVDVDGSVTDVTVIKGVENLLDWEAQRIVKRLPRFSPGIRNGRPSRFRYTLPVNFKLT
ncbi:MAG: energy transducer TonB [Bacteroidaceae bacterium]|nr:energy transducer TonB [Bacteroidaceae bacterium]